MVGEELEAPGVVLGDQAQAPLAFAQRLLGNGGAPQEHERADHQERRRGQGGEQDRDFHRPSSGAAKRSGNALRHAARV